MKPDENEPEKGAAAQDGERRMDPNTPTPPTATERQEWARLCEAATPGPLTTEDFCDYVFVVERGNIPIFESRGTGANLPQTENRRWLVALWNNAPRLLTALAAAEKCAERAEGESGAGCPCHPSHGLAPCSPQCSCSTPIMSGGCSRCAKYGSEEQRRGAARQIVEREARLAEVCGKHIRDKDAPCARVKDHGYPCMTMAEVERELARLAEVGPVVEAARDLNKALSQWERGLGIYICDVVPKRDALERALNAPRAKRGKGGAT